MDLHYIFLIVALVMFGIATFWRPQPDRYDLVAGGLFFWVLSIVAAGH